MKCLFLFPLAFILLLPFSLFSDIDDELVDQKSIQDRQKEHTGREALRLKKEEKTIDYEKIDRKNMELLRKQKARRDRLQKQFDDVVFDELKLARRTYDTLTVSILSDEALKRYQKDPSYFYTKARAYIHLFNAENLQYRYNTTKLMYERPRLETQRQDEGEIGVTLVDKLLAEDPANPEFWRLKAIFLSCFKEKVFSKEKNYLEAEAAFKKALELSPDPAEVKLAMAQFYFNKPKKHGRNPEAAKTLAEEVLKENPNSVDALLILGRYHQEKYQYEEAYNHLKQARTLEPQNLEVNYYYLIAHKDKKRFKKLMKF